jgi:MspA
MNENSRSDGDATTHPRLPSADGRIGMSVTASGARRVVPVALALVAALFTGAAMLDTARAWADPATPDPLGDVPPPPPAEIFVPSSPPATAKSADGWTLALSANSETRTPAPPLDPAVPSRDFIVNGLFNGTLRGPNGGSTPTPSGILEVGYQIQCVPSGLLAALKPSVVDVQVLKEEFKGADPSAAVTAFRVQVDCLGPALIRSYAVLTRVTNTTDAVVAYYGASTPA